MIHGGKASTFTPRFFRYLLPFFRSKVPKLLFLLGTGNFYFLSDFDGIFVNCIDLIKSVQYYATDFLFLLLISIYMGPNGLKNAFRKFWKFFISHLTLMGFVLLCPRHNCVQQSNVSSTILCPLSL